MCLGPLSTALFFDQRLHIYFRARCAIHGAPSNLAQFHISDLNPGDGTTSKDNRQAMGAMNVNSKPEEMTAIAASYLGRPVYVLASIVWAVCARVVAWFVTNAKRNTESAEIKLNKKASPRPREPLVRLKNLPQVMGRSFLRAGC